jgi:hypothetical protein
LWLAGLALVWLVPAGAEHAGADAIGALIAAEKDCLRQLVEGRGTRIVCEHPVRMIDAELADLRRATRDLVQDASCTMSVDIERRLVVEAAAASEHVFTAPPQPVSCEVRTSSATLPITFTFAPSVEIKGGIAVKASPVMAGVEGVSPILAWPVVVFVNSSQRIEQGMLEVVNAYLARFGRVRAAGR